MITTFEQFINESDNITEKMSFQEIKDKYLDNPYGIGANSVEFVEGKFGNSNRLVFRSENKYDRDKVKDNLKALGVPTKKMNTSMQSGAFSYKYELYLFENESEEAVNESGIIRTANLIDADLTSFLKDVVIPKSKGYVKSEKDAAALLFDILKNKYNF